MSPTEAMCVVERIHQPGWISDQDLEDAVCMLSDMLECVHARLGTRLIMPIMSYTEPHTILSPVPDAAALR